MKKKDELKFCRICNLGIDEKKVFVRVTEFKEKDVVASEGFYHINCYRERINGTRETRAMQDRANKLLAFATNLANKAGMGEE